MKEEPQNPGTSPLNLSELSDFQFGPSWARPGAAAGQQAISKPRYQQEREPRSFSREGGRPARSAKPRFEGRRPDSRREQAQRPPRELPQPAEGFRVELRPGNSILEVFSSEIQKQKRSLPLMDLARVVMADKSRYDLVFMKLEGGAPLHRSTKDQACWLSEAEALAYLWKAPWFSELYKTEEIETEAPKGNFNAVAVCGIGGEIIGPVNWHGYQPALMNLYRSRYSHMPLDAFRSRITVEKDEQKVADWIKAASTRTVWKPTRDGAEQIVLDSTTAVDADFRENHYASVYEITDKVFINGATPRPLLSPGLAAHVAILSDKTRRFPQMLIPNLCHGMARHHMPIYKWHGNHFTGPSRVRAIPADTVLADRMMAIINWAKENSGKKADAMFAALSGVPAGTDEESKAAATEAHAPYVADMIWLLEQGFLVVTGDNAVWYPKGDAAPEPTKPTPGNTKSGKKKGKGKPAPAPKKDNA